MSSKRTSEEDESAAKKARSAAILGISRSISACQRCRAKKIRCDQSFPKCLKCSKAGADCIGLDPATGREVPRSYVIHLEDRIAFLENRLRAHGIDPGVPNDDDLSPESYSGRPSPLQEKIRPDSVPILPSSSASSAAISPGRFGPLKQGESPTPNTKGISFAKLMFTAVKLKNRRSASENTPEIDPTTKNSPEGNLLPAILPPKSTAQQLLAVYFSQSNSQLPIFHREEFMKNCFLPIYGALDDDVSLASDYTAINSSIFRGSVAKPEETWFFQYKKLLTASLEAGKGSSDEEKANPILISNKIVPPQKFHRPLFFLNIVFAISSSVHHLQYLNTISESFKLSAMKYLDSVYACNDQLEILEAYLLLALYSLMRPTNPGVWHVLGLALRASVDLGLHNEKLIPPLKLAEMDSFVKDRRRRLFWCTYSIDRQICFYFERPNGIPEESIDCPFPSELDDALIVQNDTENPDYLQKPSPLASYKFISVSFFRIRQIQSEVQRVLFGNAEVPRRFNGLSEWKENIRSQLVAWKKSIPKDPRQMNSKFNVEFFNLNYNHTLIMLHGLSPRDYALTVDDFQILAESSKNLILCYQQLYDSKSINYTWAAVHNLFMAGTSYLYAIYNSPEVSENTGVDEVRKVSEHCINVLNSLVDKCDASVICRDTYKMLTLAILKLKYNEEVHGLDLDIPSSHQISKSQPVGYINSNLLKLVDILKDSTMKEHELLHNGPGTHVKFESTVSPAIQDADVQYAIDQSRLQDAAQLQNGDTALSYNSIHTPQNHSLEAISHPDDHDMDFFFSELENLSPVSTISKANSFIGQNGGPEIPKASNAGTGAPIQKTAPTVPHEGKQQEGGPPSKDVKRVFELMHLMPNEAIWDQFFTALPGTLELGPPQDSSG